ncbi:alpha-1,2-fucosyltransferase [Saccharicrinis sp. FJH62]|uniref:alpha-1,2-fucosyltransferase n=1 Tax=Saccharicrinis sp. FJH62 TaxID=3344657 RepID=UPI0035D51DED
MIVIRLRSGLGNQMFQYAFFKQMQFWHGEANVKLDIDTYHWKAHNGLEIDTVFNLDLNPYKISSNISLKLADVGYSLKDRIARRIRGTRHKSYKFWKDMNYNDYKNINTDLYLEGYWNEEKYFFDVKEDIKKAFKFPIDKNEPDLLNEIRNCNSVSLHVRRGDYINYPDNFPMCTPKYYVNALAYLKSKINQNLNVYVFSDEIEWCKTNLGMIENITFVNNKTAHHDMMMMSFCKHNIIANSTFSWWAAWLNKNPNKIVIYPNECDRTYGSMPKHWIKL